MFLILVKDFPLEEARRFSHLAVFPSNNLKDIVLFDGSADPDEGGSEEHVATGEIDAAAAAPPSSLNDSERTDDGAIESHRRVTLSAWGDEPLAGQSTISYGIRTESGGHICAITVPRVRLYPGTVVRLLVSFTHSQQGCERVSAALMQNEKRVHDGVILKVK